MYTPEAVKSQSSTENLLSNIRYMVNKCRKFGFKNTLISGLVYTTKVFLEVLKKSMKNLVLFVLVMV